MPGIVGIIGKLPRAIAEEELAGMLQAIRHEDFYKTGTLVHESLGVYVGWTVPENSFAEGTPYRNERGDLRLVFSGEEYPDPGDVQRLKAQGHRWEGEGGAYLAHVYEEDRHFPRGLNGMFHGLALDEALGEVI